MARASLFEFKIDLSELEDAANRLGQIDPDSLGLALVSTINDQAKSAYQLSRRSILGGVNIERDYLESRFELRYATSKKPVAEIVTPVNKKTAATNISHYGAMRFAKPVKHPERSKGDPYRGFAPGMKADFMTAQVTRGGDKSIGEKFVIQGIEDSAGNPIVFRGLGKPGKPRNPKDKGRRKTPRQAVQPVLGPSPYQLFRVAAETVSDQVSNDFAGAVADRVQREFERTLR